MKCMGGASAYGEQEVGVASGNGWNLWVWLLGVVVRRYNYRFPHTTPLVSVFLQQQHPYFLFILKNVLLLLCFTVLGHMIIIENEKNNEC